MNDRPMTDDTPMPFGKFAGTRMGDIPSDYLAWLQRQPDVPSRHPHLYEYAKSHADQPTTTKPNDDPQRFVTWAEFDKFTERVLKRVADLERRGNR